MEYQVQQREWRKEWNRLRADEVAYLRSHSRKRENIVNKKAAEIMPDDMQEVLNKAFDKAFALIFEKGTGFIEKTYPKEKIRLAHREAERELSNGNKQKMEIAAKSRREAEKSKGIHLAVSAVEGGVLGALGIGVPDIPVFVGVLLRSIYEIAEHYGYNYESEWERIFILKLMENAMCWGEELRRKDRELNDVIESGAAWKESAEEQTERTARALSKELLYMKFLQTIPLAGVIGGTSDVWCMKQIGDYAELKYRRRFLINRDSMGQ